MNLANLEIEKTTINATGRKFEFGKIRVCSDCGSCLWSPDVHCCKGNTESLKEYYERVEGKPFSEEGWSFEYEDMECTQGIDLDAEMAEILRREIVIEEIQRNSIYNVNNLNEEGRPAESDEEHPQADAETD